MLKEGPHDYGKYILYFLKPIKNEIIKRILIFKMTSIIVEIYSEKAIVVRNTLEHHGTALSALGGTFNERLKGGRGWIFPKHMLTQIRNVVEKLNSGQYGNEYEQNNTQSSVTTDTVPKTEFLSLLTRVERLEALVSQLIHKNDNECLATQAPIQKMVRITPPKIVSMDEIDESDAPVFEKKRLVPMKK